MRIIFSVLSNFSRISPLAKRYPCPSCSPFFIATKTVSETNESSNENNSSSALASRDPNVQRQRTEDRPKTAAVSSSNLNGSSRRSKRLNMSPEEKDGDSSFSSNSSNNNDSNKTNNHTSHNAIISFIVFHKSSVNDIPYNRLLHTSLPPSLPL